MRFHQQSLIALTAALPLQLGALGALAADLPGPLVDTQWLADNRDAVVVLDVRRDPQSFIRKTSGGGEIGGVQACGASGGGAAVSGHISDSALIDWKEIAVTQKTDDVTLKDMVPSQADFEQLMQRSGVSQDSLIVVTNPGDSGSTVADGTRLYWTLKYFGHDKVALLDGGVAKWAGDGHKIEYGRTKPKQGDWTAPGERPELLASLEEVQQAVAAGDTQVIDVRTPEYYLGLKHKAEKVAAKGHIDGAKNLPFLVYISENGKGSTFYPRTELQRITTELGIDSSQPVISHCNTGHLASSGWFVMHELLGDEDTQLYVGSMNEWAADPSRSVSTSLQ